MALRLPYVIWLVPSSTEMQGISRVRNERRTHIYPFAYNIVQHLCHMKLDQNDFFHIKQYFISWI